MQISYRLLTYMSRLGDTDATAALAEWSNAESIASKRNIPIPYIEAHFSPPDLFFIHVPNMPRLIKTHPGLSRITLTGMPIPSGIPLEDNYPIPMIQIIDADGGTDEDD